MPCSLNDDKRAVSNRDVKEKSPARQGCLQTPLPSLSGYLHMGRSPIHLSLLILFIKEEKPRAAGDPRYRRDAQILRHPPKASSRCRDWNLRAEQRQPLRERAQRVRQSHSGGAGDGSRVTGGDMVRRWKPGSDRWSLPAFEQVPVSL